MKKEGTGLGTKNKLSQWIAGASRKKSFLGFLLFVFFVAGYFIGKERNKVVFDDTTSGDNYYQVRQSGYKFINPLLECEIGETLSFKPMENETKGRIQKDVLEKNSGTDVSVYFRSLNNGPWFGINEQESFSPASLLKVPLMITYFKIAERNPEILKEKTVFNPSNVQFKQTIPVSRRLEKGREYSIEELIEEMIVYSDNDALALLFGHIDQEELKKVFSDLNINMPDIYSANNSMPVKDFASFFRILYNASYLRKEMSEKALEMLSRSAFKEGIVLGVPKEIIVAHKFGEREANQNGKIIRQLHDCGIVYYDPYPYLVCIMTRGEDFKTLSGIIGKISEIIFEEVSVRYK
jgi:beta-lactamase class A